MKPGEIITKEGNITINKDLKVFTLTVSNTGDRPVQVGSHYHFAEANEKLDFDRKTAHGKRLNIPSGTAVRFEPGQVKAVRLIPFKGQRKIFGFSAQVMGDL